MSFFLLYNKIVGYGQLGKKTLQITDFANTKAVFTNEINQLIL